MSKKSWLVYMGIALGLGLLGWYALWSVTPYPVSVYERIRLGMTESEVETIIGVPPGHHTVRRQLREGGSLSGPFGHFVQERGVPSNCLFDASDRPGCPAPLTLKTWIWDDDWIWVAFDQQGKVAGCYLIEVNERLPPLTWWEHLRTLFGR
jgi:hypothetical protein